MEKESHQQGNTGRLLRHPVPDIHAGPTPNSILPLLETISRSTSAASATIIRISPNETLSIPWTTHNQHKKSLFGLFTSLTLHFADSRHSFSLSHHTSFPTGVRFLLAHRVGNQHWLLLLFRTKPWFLSLRNYSFPQLDQIILHEECPVNHTHKLIISAVQSLTRSGTKEDAFQRTLRALQEITGCDRGSIWGYHDLTRYGGPRYLSLEGAQPDDARSYPHHCLEEGSGLVWRALQKRSPELQKGPPDRFLFIPAVQSSDIINPVIAPVGQPVLLIRLEASGELHGVACLAGIDPQVVEKMRPVFDAFIDVVVAQVRHRKTDRRTEILERLPTLIPFGEIDLGKCCQLITSRLLPFLKVQAASILLKPELDPAAQKMCLTYSSVMDGYEMSDDLADFLHGKKTIEYSIKEDSLSSTVVRDGKSIATSRVFDDRRNSHRYREIKNRKNSSWLGVPITTSDGSPIGLIRCTGKMRNIGDHIFDFVFDENDVSVIETFARTLSPLFDTIEVLNRIDRMNSRLEASERIREHEMKAPLSCIAANAQFVLQHISDSGVTSKQRRLAEIVSDTQMCAFMVRESAVVRKESVWKDVVSIDPRPLVREVCSFLAQRILSRSRILDNVSGEVQFDDFSISQFMTVNSTGYCSRIMANKVYLQRVFYNLGVNAIKYGMPGGYLSIRLSESVDHKEALFDFIDTGIGVDEEDVESIFIEGKRGRNAELKCEGQGIGLSISKDIVEAHGGKISLVSRSSPTVFRVSIPLAPTPSSEGQDAVRPRGIVRWDRPRPMRSKSNEQI